MNAEQLDLLTAARDARDAALEQVEEASVEWDRAAIDQAIRDLAALGRPFSANDVRPLLPPGVRPALVGARFMAAARREEIVEVGQVRSTDRGTHAKRIAMWLGRQEAVA